MLVYACGGPYCTADGYSSSRQTVRAYIAREYLRDMDTALP